MLPSPALRQVLPTLSRIVHRGPWYRAVNYDHVIGPPPGSPAGAAVQPLWPGGAARRGARFTPRGATGGAAGPPSGIDCLYLAEDELTPLLEITGVLRPPGSAVPLLFDPQVMMTVDGVLWPCSRRGSSAAATSSGSSINGAARFSSLFREPVSGIAEGPQAVSGADDSQRLSEPFLEVRAIRAAHAQAFSCLRIASNSPRDRASSCTMPQWKSITAAVEKVLEGA